jgi:tape measure domain-containing protein
MKGGFNALLDGVAAFGGTDDVMKRATIAISQMSGKGVIQMEELRQQLGEAMPRAVEIMARSMGVSMSQLIQIISKGTLEAKSALEAFFIETEATFGGAALEQMQTFNGRLAQMTTLWQLLATTAGDAGFFEAVKKQLADLNTFLAGPTAERFAKSLGSGLASIVGGLRQALDGIVRFRDEIVQLAMILGGGISIKVLLSGLMNLSGALFGVIPKVQQLGLAWNGMVEKIRFNNLDAATAPATAAISRTTLAVRNMSAVWTMAGVAISTVSSVIIPLAGLIGVLAVSFGLFSDKSADAYQNLVKFGAESRKQVMEAEPYLKSLERRLELAKQSQVTINPVTGQATIDGPNAQEIARLTRERDEARAVLAKAGAQADQREAENIAREEQDKLDGEIRQIQKSYDAQAKIRSKAYDDELKEANKNRGDISAIQAKYSEEHKKALVDQLQAQYDIYEDRINAINALAEDGDARAISLQDKYVFDLIKKQGALREQMIRIRELAAKPVEIDKSINLDKLLERAKAKTDDLKGSNAGMRAELAGASSDMAKLLFMIEEAVAKKNYVGPLSNADIKEQIENLKKEMAVHDELSQKINAQNKINAEIQRLNQKATEDMAEAKIKAAGGDKLSGTQRFMIQLREGVFNGKTQLQQIKDKWGDIGRGAAEAGSEMKRVFDSLMEPGGAVVNLLQRAATGFQNLSNIKGGAGASGGAFSLPSFSSGNSLTDRIINRESGGRDIKNPNSTASGPGQFIEKTWLAFLTETHKDLLAGGREAALALRSDSELARQATQWLMGKSAAEFRKNGIEPTDANLRLGHFLGPAGASAALSQSDETLVRSIPILTEAIRKNYEVFKNITTVGDLKAWALRQVGSGTTPIGGPRTSGPALTPEQQAALDDTAQKELAKKAFDAAQALDERTRKYLNGVIENATADAGKLSNLAQVRADIMNGKGPSGVANKNPDDPIFKDLLAAAQALDESDAKYAERKKLRTALQSAADRKAAEDISLLEKQNDLDQQLRDEQKLHFSSKYYAELRRLARETADQQKAVSTGVTDQATSDKFLEGRKAQIAMLRDNEIKEALKTEQQKTIAIERSLMTVDGEREKTYQDDIRRNQQYLALYQGTGEDRVRVEQMVERNIRALRAQQFTLNPMGKLMKDWSDFGKNIYQAGANWLDQTADKLADFVTTGKANFADLAASISKSLASIAIKGAFGQLISNMLGIPTGGKSLGKGGSAPMNILPAMHHTGGLAGAMMPYRSVSPALFAGASRFHGGTGGLTLSGDEIPIIAKRGEQVDWPANLAKQYGGGGTVFSPTVAVTVQGSAGMTDADHQKMGEAVGRAAMDHIRRMMGDEIRMQTRPGGILAR